MFIKTDDENNIVTYPYSLEQFRAENKNTSLPKFLNNRYLETKNVYPVYSSVKPDYDEINQNIRLDIDNPFLDTDGVWKYGWIITEKTTEQKSIDFEKAKIDFKNKINELRDSAIYKTRNIVVNQTTTVPVDIRKDHPDIQNISGLVQAATLSIINNSSTNFNFKGADNQVYQLTSQEVIIMGSEILTQNSEIYSKSWLYKEQLENTTTIEEINQIILNYD